MTLLPVERMVIVTASWNEITGVHVLLFGLPLGLAQILGTTYLGNPVIQVSLAASKG